MSVLLFVLENCHGGWSCFGIEHCFRMSSKDACKRGFINCVVTRSHFPLMSDKNDGSNLLINSIFLNIGMLSLYIMPASMACIGMIAKLCKNVFYFTIVL